jgi:hypothetical protein
VDRRSKQGSRGYDAGKKVAGRVRHILTDADGRLLDLQVQTASLRDGAKPAQCTSRRRWNFADVEFADGGSVGRPVDWAKEKADLALPIVKRPRAMLRFEPLPRR